MSTSIQRALISLLALPLLGTCVPNEPGPATSPTAQTLVWGKDDTAPQSSWRPPAVGGSYVDESYGTTIRRLTSADGTRFDRNTYSRRQPENADGSRFMTYHGDAAYRVYDRASTDLVRVLDIHPDAEPQWHPTDPDRVRFIAGSNASVGELRLYEIMVSTGAQTVLADLTDRIQTRFPSARYLADEAEGSPSADGSRYAWTIYDQNEDVIGLVSYDLGTDTILGLIPPPRSTAQGPNWMSMAPSGNHVLAGWLDGTHRYAADLTGETRLTLTAEHSDIAINAAGHDAYVFIDFSAGPNGGWLVSIDLETLAETRIFDVYDDANTSIHVSGKAYDRPGWVVVSTYNCKEPGAWSCEKVMVVELAPGGRILNLAHSHNCGESYWTETHAAANRDLTRVYFNTDRGSCGIDAEVMEITVPPFD